ncbi:MAG: LTA synthase family protein [Clostridia bacterium]|nr:LTA synthase family protein [Clostridia bacterium]
MKNSFQSKTASFFQKTLPDFCKENITVSSTKASRITAAIVTAVLLLTVIVDHKAYTDQTFRDKWILLALCLIFPFLIGLVIKYRLEIKQPIAKHISTVLLLIVMPILTMSMTECLNSVYIYDMTYLGFFANYVVITFFYLLIYALSGSLRLPILIINPIFFLLGVSHCYLMEFRGTPFLPMDFLAIKTGMGVANTYKFTLNYLVLTATLIFIFSIAIAIRLKTPVVPRTVKLSLRLFSATFTFVVAFLFYGTSVFADAGVKPDFWNQNRGYHNFGFAYNFVCNTKYLFMSAPSGYDAEKVGDYVSKVVEETNTADNTAKTPNIICIMNESLADLQVLGSFETNEDYMPFLHSLTENTVRGNLYVPVIGAGTSNTEFEFLTGHSTAFLPSGSNAYMLYIKNPLASLTSTLKAQNYSALALHPYYAAGWNRVKVYQNMGFDNFMSLENLMDISIMSEYVQNGNDPNYLQSLVEQYYPDRNMLMRQYISDAYNYQVLIKDYENRDKTKPYYTFNVTMQNHGGYSSSCRNFPEVISVTSSQNVYNKANKYLSLVRASDAAFEELINYFKQVKEPTVICMFGDHQPSVEPAFIAELLGTNNLSGLTLDQEQRRHVTPFYIWANYDIEEQQIERLSVNYLATKVLEVANVQMTEYNKYLLKLSEKLPVIDTVGYIDADGTNYRWSDRSDYTDLLDEYERIQYNNIFDSKNTHNQTFYLNGYTLPNPQDEPQEENQP